MVQCQTCGTEDHFKLVTGFYYCTVCNSQSQHAVEEELDLAFEANPDASRVFTAGHVVGKSRTKTKGASSRFRSYRRLNIYNDLLRRLVDELIQLGAPPRLKVVTMELWFKYIDILEVDAEPYGKLPPFCLKEEFEMTAKRIKEESFGLKRAVFNHVSMRYRSAYKQRHKNSWYKQHSSLCGYRPVKAPRMQATGLSEIMSGLSTTDRESGGDGSGMSTASMEGSSEALSEENIGSETGVALDDGVGEVSGFGFGGFEMSGFSFGEPFKEADTTIDPHSQKTTSDRIGSADSMDSQMDTSAANVVQSATTETPMDLIELSFKAEDNKEATIDGTFSVDVNQEATNAQIEDIDLTSSIAYKLKSYMESRDQTSLEHYVEPVFQMHSSCLIMILYLGVVQAKVYHIGILDIYRFIRQKSLTYLDAREGVAEDLLKWRQNLFFNMTLPDIHPVHTGMGSFVRSTGILAALLGIKELQVPPVEYFIVRVGLDINLPGEILSMAVKVSREFQLQPSWTLDSSDEFPHLLAKHVPLMELEACAILLFVLKYLFGIDGTSEYAASLEAEQKGRQEGVKYFVISHWLTQFSRRAHFLRRRGEYYKCRGPLEFEHIRSAAYLIRHEAKRRADFYQRGIIPRNCGRFLDDTAVAFKTKLSSPKLAPSSWPLKNALRTFIENENRSDPLHLLNEMTNDRVIMKTSSEFPLSSRFHARCVKEAAMKMTDAAETVATGSNPIAPPENMITLMTLLGEYCFCSSLRLHRALLRIETKIAQS